MTTSKDHMWLVKFNVRPEDESMTLREKNRDNHQRRSLNMSHREAGGSSSKDHDFSSSPT